MIHSYPWYFADWRSSEAVLCMTLEQRGLYRELLDHCWEAGSLPADEGALRKISQATDKEWARSWPKVASQFLKRDGRLWHSKVDERRPELLRWAEARRRGGLARHAPTKADATPSAIAESKAELDQQPSSSPPTYTSSSPDTHTEPPVCAPKPNHSRPPRAADVGQVSMRFDEFCEKYPRITDIDGTGHLWVSHVTVDNEAAVFSELDRYLASSEVARGVILASPRYLLEGHRDRWKRKWPAAEQMTRRGAQAAIDHRAAGIAERRRAEALELQGRRA